MVCTERVLQYTQLPQEASLENSLLSIPETWPERGCISFRNMSLQYQDGGPWILNDITLVVDGGHKVIFLSNLISVFMFAKLHFVFTIIRVTLFDNCYHYKWVLKSSSGSYAYI